MCFIIVIEYDYLCGERDGKIAALLELHGVKSFKNNII